MKTAIAILGIMVVIHMSASPLGANPSHQQLDASLAVHGKEFSGELHKRAMEFYEPAKRKLFDFLEKESEGDLQKIRAEDLGDAHVLIMRLTRAADHLQYLGEPAGRDFDLRASTMRNHVGRMIERSKPFPATQKYIAAFRQFIAKTTAARAKAVAELQKLAGQGKWEQAEADLYRLYDRLQQGTVFLTVDENKVIYEPFWEVESAIRAAMSQIRSAKAKEILERVLVDITPKYPQLLEEVRGAVDALGTSPQATWRGESVNGVQLVERLGQLWRETQVAVLQAQAKSWALTYRRNAAGMSMPEMTGVGNRQMDERFVSDFAAFSSEIVKAIGRVIESDAAKADATNVAAIYTAYLHALAPLSRESNSQELAASTSAALSKLAAKDPGFQQQVAAYDAATSDLLRWRARAAASQSARVTAEYMPIEKRFYEGTVSSDSYVGLFPPPAVNTSTPQLNAPAPDVMKTAVERLMGTKVLVQDVVRLPGDSRVAVARYTGRTYANIPVDVNLQAEVDALKQDLFVSDQAPPLTLVAMRAVTTAERGDMVAVGGTVAGTYLEAVITRFATLPASASVLTTLGQLPPEHAQGSGLSQVLMRFNIKPSWMQHDYFFASTAPATELTLRESLVNSTSTR